MRFRRTGEATVVEYVLLVLLSFLVGMFMSRVVVLECSKASLSVCNERLIAQEELIVGLLAELDTTKTESVMNTRDRIIQLQPKLDPSIAYKIAVSIEANCEKYNIPSSLVIHLISRESSFNVFSKSSKECMGLMQVRFPVHRKMLKEMGISSVYSLYHIDNNINAGCRILSNKLSKSKSISGALQKYVGAKNKKTKQYANDILGMMREYKTSGGGA